VIVIRAAGPTDAEAVAAIYGAHVADGFGTFEEIAPDTAEMGRRMESVWALDFPFLLAEEGRELLGFAYASPFRLRSAYR
jgi:phosphinothricin acetyltransferase